MTVSLITGASSGIGTLYARRLAARGHDLVLVARDVERLVALARDLHATHGATVEVLPADLTVPAQLQTVEDRLSKGAPVDILVNNAGMAVLGGFAAAPRAKLAQMLDLNVHAPTFLAHAVLPGMVARGGGAIVNVASVLALLPEYSTGGLCRDQVVHAHAVAEPACGVRRQGCLYPGGPARRHPNRDL